MSRKYKAIFASSVDPHEFSMTVRGLLVAIVPVAMSLAPFFSIDPVLLEDLFGSVEGFLNSLDTLIVAVSAAWAGVEIVVGASRKILVALKLKGVNK